MVKIATGKGFELELPESYDKMKREAEETITKILEDKPKALKLWKLMQQDAEVNADWDMSNYIAVAKLHFNDHGEIHMKIVAANALRMLRLLDQSGVVGDLVKEKAGDIDDDYLVVLAGGLLHDIGNQVHRVDHNLHGVYLAIPLLDRLLPEVYEDPEIMYEIRGHILNCIYSHEYDVQDLTTEAALVGISDGTDMTKGRGRMSFDSGNVNIHTVSALSIEEVNVTKGTSCPIGIYIKMSNSAGIFQIQETLFKKIVGGPLESYIEVIAESKPDEPTQDERIVHRVVLQGRKFKAL
jgi:metal-dependent HD superfamily phosphatase/phosphodiesterase